MAKSARKERHRARRELIDEFVDAVQRQGRYTFTDGEAASAVGLSPSGWEKAIRRLQGAGRIVRPLPRRGFFIVVPHEFHSMGAPPVAWYLDALMRFLEIESYYVGLLTAAEWHGASHFAVQETQIVVPRQLRPRRIGRETIRFIEKKDAARTPVEERQVETGTVRLSTPEATVLDLVRYVEAAGGLSMVATVLAELKGGLSRSGLRHALNRACDVTAAQRLGYLLELAGQKDAAQSVASWLEEHPLRTRPLDPTAPVELASVAQPWNVAVNADIEIGE